MPRTLLLAADHQNSIIAELAGGQANPIAYSAYGGQSAPQAIATYLGFNGELCERRIGWYLLGNGYRAYNPVLMRFHSPDSWSPFGKGGRNAYVYCGGDPRNFTDPTGQMFKSFLGFKKSGKTLNNAQSTSSLNPLIPPSSSTEASRLSTSPPGRAPVNESLQGSKNTGNPLDPYAGESIYGPLPIERRNWTLPPKSTLPKGMMSYEEMAIEQGFTGRSSTSVLASEQHSGPPVDRTNKPPHFRHNSKPLPPVPDEALSKNSAGEDVIDLKIYIDSIRK